LKPTDLQQNRSGLARFLLLQSVEYGGYVGGGLFFFGLRNRPADHLVDFAILTLTDETLQLLSLGQFAEWHRAVDR
jgi:hypothetical protein